jgi:pimeloyl-ACP methyl ester carboxylesterase
MTESVGAVVQSGNGTEPHHPYPKLKALSSYEDQQAGIAETFLAPELGGAKTVAVLSSPLSAKSDIAWVLCHSFALEQIYLQPLEVPFVRELSSTGFEVLRYHSQGYGDSELPANVVSLSSHVRDAVDAVALLRERGVKRIGLMGSRFGGSVAALAADKSDADALILWEPVIKGREYMNLLTRRAIVSQLTIRANGAGGAKGSGAPKAEDPLLGLEDENEADLQGFPLSSSAHKEIMGLDLMKDLTHFSGASLVVQISRSAEQRPALKRFVGRLQELGGAPSHEVVEHPRPHLFGRPRYKPTANGGKIDSQAEMSDGLTECTLKWCAALGNVAPEVAGQ